MIPKSLRNRKSIRYKLAAFTFSIVAIALIMSAVINNITNFAVAYGYTKNRLEVTNNFIVQSIQSFHADTAHDDAHDLGTFFQSLRLETYLDMVCYYHDGALLASYINYDNPDHGVQMCPSTFSNTEMLTISGWTHVSDVIEVTDANNEFLGHLYVVYDIDRNLWILLREFLVSLGVIVFGGILVWIYTFRHQDFIIKPVMHLAGLAVTLAQKPDYCLRAKKFSDDELGLLSDSFNDMIAGMEQTYVAIQDANARATEATKQKSAFLAMMSHEIRTPINGIIGTADLLSETHLTGRQKEYVHIIEKSAENLLHLVNDILDYSKIEAEKLTIEEIPFNLVHHIQDVIDMLQVNIRQEGLGLYFKNRLASQTMLLQGDPVRIKQILINFVTNAIKFTEKGSITVELSEDQGADKGVKNITISVTDTGIGIPKDRHDSIFESFSQADDSTTRKYGGSGLGLTICKRLVEKMNGHIGVESEVGQGSRFWVTIPMRIADEETEDGRPVKAPQDILVPVVNDNRVLFAEDNETNIMITAEILRQAGYDVILCHDGEEAVLAYQNEPVPLVLMDCQMPVMDGWEATRHIRNFERENGLLASRIIALTANAMDGDQQKCLDAGMDDYLAKPFKKRDLLHKLGNIVKSA